MEGKLILTRKGSAVNRRQRYKILIDGAEAGEIKNDGTEELILAAGTHTLQCKMNWMSSEVKTIVIKEGANTYLRVGNAMKFIVPLYFMMLAGVLLPFFFHLLKMPVPAYMNNLKIILIFPALIYYIFYITFYRKKYLEISEDNNNPFK